ncbi:hypothetical protein ARC78_08095 [Stenotrophomonas pictorum JCM 9942]|uniref:Uncharacterized protein n=1 Tax=Stenotrophomonas pictorum JCM 9942 TaxID=1236960 RepID=A0A0R0AR08_9GAMM|nr:hypothetical protein [Stenotrophomonas pictorum]KRG42936.1 hypothetical protein ARC78_08095 [Stenotrophomonas pictorum JCM 9942]
MTESDDDHLANEYHFLELFQDFSQASRRAKQLARTYEGLVRVKREDSNFKILVPLWVKSEILDPPPPAPKPSDVDDDPEDDDDDYYDPIDEELNKEQEELRNEVYGSRDDWGRSTEEGWFYDDGDA